MSGKGAIACGHPATAEAAAAVLDDGGNAFDAALAAIVTACVAEPVLASLGGGGFALTRAADGRTALYDFFTQTPVRPRPPAEVDFHGVLADFGAARQEFHIGLGAVATPGLVKGLFAVHRDLGRLPMRRIVAPAAALARDGVRVEPLQAFIFTVVAAIYTATPAARALFASRTVDGAMLREGEVYRVPEFADTLEALADEGAALFYEGDIARRILADLGHGGHLTADDFARYRVARRAPLRRRYRDAELAINPPPSSGGVLVAFALALLEGADLAGLGFGTAPALELLARVMAETNRARIESRMQERPADEVAAAVLDPALVAAYRDRVHGAPFAGRGTTHVSVIDAAGNACALSVSNGEGSAYIVPGTGIMLNNMLGEEDLNPQGFVGWPADRRMSSMMAPALVDTGDGRTIAMGSGGSNRIRSAILQVLVNVVDHGMDIADAVEAPRIHFEADKLEIETGFAVREVAALAAAFPHQNPWPDRNIFFGGVHAARAGPRGVDFGGGGDPRRGGVVRIV